MNKLAMIIEDDKDSAYLFSHVLEFVGFETEVFLSGKKALDFLKTNIPIIILLDLHLSQELSGQDILMRIRAEKGLSKTHVIVITGYPNLAETIGHLADLILIKPVSMPQLSALVSRICNDQISETFFRHASYNALTGLPNRALLRNRLEYAIARSKREKTWFFALLIVQIANLEPIRLIDELPSGNNLLMSFVERLKKQLREVDTLASLGNDAFAILLEDVKSPDDAKLVAIRLQTELDKPYLINEKETSLSVDIRIVPSVHVQENIDKILESIDQQMGGTA